MYNGGTEHPLQARKRMCSLDQMIQSGDLVGIKKCRLEGVPWGERSMWYAVRAGRLDVMRYLHESGVPWNEHSTFDAYSGSLCVSDLATSVAAWLDQVECLQFLVERGCKIDPRGDGVWRHRLAIVHAMARRRAAFVIQARWHAARARVRARAVSVIADAYITWACRPREGLWYRRALESFRD